jgi:pyruvate,water dikinase
MLNVVPEAVRSIAWLGEHCADTSLLGGKASSLCRLAGEHPIPPGFSVTAAAYEQARTAAEGDAGVPAWLRAEIAAAYRRLGERSGVPEPRVAVRSSAVDEDGAAASFAGQHETYLNVVGADAVAEAVARCWASLRSARAAEYRRQQGLRGDDARIAVLVQQLVPADASAVVFSANPVTGRRDEVVVNAIWGLGESIVGGTTTPDTYLIRKPDLAVAARRIGAKERMTVLAPEGTREVDVPRLLRGALCLTDEQAQEMARLAIALEARLGHPVDVECAYHEGRLYLLQCRPITTLR